ncbi:MAG: Maf family protein [Oscillospiraceae bacterium]|jgi:septum formation protein|nr:Maf family protein [Oscillospiraceae bacterium]
MIPVVLASASPRRAELLQRIGLPFTLQVPDVDETTSSPAETAVAELSLRKGKDVAARCPGSLVIAADTLVVCGGEVLGKPKNEGDAFRMLRLLSGRRHTVHTGVSVLRGGASLTNVETASVWVRELTGSQIRAYIATGEPMDKAGSYGIQALGAALVERIEGDFFAVMGLPVCLLSKMLAEFGFDLLGRGEDP